MLLNSKPMVSLRLLTVLLAAGVTLAGCTKDSKAVDSDGNCKEATVESYNDVLTNASLYGISSESSSLSNLQSSCSQFKDLIGGQSCKAENLMSGDTVSISGDTVNQYCDVTAAATPTSDDPVTMVTPDPNVNDSGIDHSCSDIVIADYSEMSANRILNQMESSTESQSKLNVACEKFKSDIGDLTCDFSDAQGKREISSTTADQFCN